MSLYHNFFTVHQGTVCNQHWPTSTTTFSTRQAHSFWLTSPKHPPHQAPLLRTSVILFNATNGSTVAGSALNYFKSCGSVVVDSKRNIYVSDPYNSRVRLWLNGSSAGTIIAGSDLATNSLVIANRISNNVVRWIIGASTWTLVVDDIGGAAGTSSKLLNSPCSLAFDVLGNLYVADTFNHRIQFFQVGSANGTTVAGKTGVFGSNATLVNVPYALKLDNENNLYVADTYNQRVQRCPIG
ncbi:unnamed protein product [Adineta ricciae]|uniref:NHL repeat-containing protein n=1 Tax=Adineta ricciae TaxID=249248 RepID=A0A815X7I1_ADIRI|nr:unnamed protein product [Adineta ricciae]